MNSKRWRRDAEEFASALERGRSSRSDVPDDVAELLAFVEELKHSAIVEPAPEFASSLRANLVAEAEAETVLIKHPAPSALMAREQAATRRRRRLAVAVASLVVAGGGAGLAMSSASALPGDMLYPIKRGIESAQSAIRSSEAGQGSYDLERATSRLSEAVELAASGGSDEHITDSLEQFSSLSRSGADRLIAVHEVSGSVTPLNRVTDFTVAAAADLAELQPLLSTSTESAWIDARNTLRTLSDTVGALCAACDDVSVDALTSLRDNVEHSAAPGSGSPSQKTPDSDKEESSESEEKAPKDDETKKKQPDDDKKPDKDEKEPAPDEEDKPKESPGLLDPITGLLFGNDEKPGLIGGLLGGKK